MREEGFIGGLTLVMAGVFMLWLAPDNLSLLIVLSMLILILLGFICGVRLVVRFSKGFVVGQGKIENAKTVQAEHTWYALRQEETIFEQKFLDALFDEYQEEMADNEEWEVGVMCDIENYINESNIRTKVWKDLLDLIPGTLTGMGILGTFLGLMMGLGGIGFDNLSETMISIQTLLVGVRIAFYTSICGVILSILYNFIYHIIWEMMLRELERFLDQFHRHVIPSLEDQMNKEQALLQKKLLQWLERN